MSHEPAENSMETITQKPTENGQPGSLRSGRLLASLRKAIREQIASMRNCAKAARSGKGYAHPELQPLRDASAHAEEFWAKILEETLEANNPISHAEDQP